MWTRSVPLALVLSLAALPAAAKEIISVDDDHPCDVCGGSATNLPVGGGVAPSTLIAHAYTMPQVQAAIAVMQHRGYVAHADADQAIGLVDPVASAVALSWEKPGIVPPPGTLAAPAILVFTVLDPGSGLPVTNVTGGVAFVDQSTAHTVTAEDVPGFGPSDASFDVVPSGGGGGRGGRLIFPTWFGTTNSSGDIKFRRWAACTAIGSAAVLLDTLFPPVPQIAVPKLIIKNIFVAAVCAATAME